MCAVERIAKGLFQSLRDSISNKRPCMKQSYLLLYNENIRNQKWDAMANMRVKKHGASGALVDNQLFIIGGINGDKNFFLKTFEMYLF